VAVLFKMVRRPRTRKTPEDIRKELRKAYEYIMWPAIEADLKQEVAGWQNQPTFKFHMRISGRMYLVDVRVDRRTKAGKIFVWVDLGTMDEGNPATTYPIDAVNVPKMVFDVPYQPMTMPTPPDVLNYNPAAPIQTIATAHVDHPGIVPRRISERTFKKYRDRRNRKGFYRVTENAYRRGFRKVFRLGRAISGISG
jgi:hypothetical protein